MDDIPLSVLFIALFILLLLSAFFSGSETGLMTLNRYRLRHLADKKHPGARRAQQLLEQPDRLIGLILLGNNLVNILASMLTTLIALRIAGQTGVAIAAGLLVLVILIFAEVTPKTLAALHPERIAFPAAFIYVPLLRIFYPLVWLVNIITNTLLKKLGVPTGIRPSDALSSEELRTVVKEAGAMIPERHQAMLLNIIDLEKVTVEDVMVPRNDVTGIDINDDWETITRQLSDSQYTRLPVYRETIDRVIGILHMRDVLPLLQRGQLDADALQQIMREPFFIPENTSLNRQLLHFQRQKRRIGFVVDEYGDLQGLVTLEDILEEVVGEFTTDPADLHEDIVPQEDGTWLVDGSINIRTLNSALDMSLSTDGPRTLNGLITEYLETIPDIGTSLLLDRHPVDIIQIRDNMIKTVRIHAPLAEKTNGTEEHEA
ncbi:MAG: HlyC/CorC family transporter [Gammaproteobacteria bacterium]|nr:MAG: HlyC/CorC family transporter [Gammaproteobacteria bacterium]